MQSSPKPHKDHVRVWKLFLVSGSLAASVGLWNLFSSQAIQKAETDPVQLPPLPTLVPVVSVPASNPVQQPVQPTLRAVSGPGATAPTPQQPVIQTILIDPGPSASTDSGANQQSSSVSSGSSAPVAPPPVTSTGSSR